MNNQQIQMSSVFLDIVNLTNGDAGLSHANTPLSLQPLHLLQSKTASNTTMYRASRHWQMEFMLENKNNNAHGFAW